jgi:S1-C subfamily serine protease
MNKTKLYALTAFLALLLAGCQITAATNPIVLATNTPTVSTLPTLSPSTSNETQQDRLVEIYKIYNPGVVSIHVSSAAGDSLGSGIVYDKQGDIITNYHVVQDATDIEVDFPSGIKANGTVIGNDPDSDLAVIKVDVAAEELTPLVLGNSDNVEVGQTVLAIGSPFGYENTLTSGIVSAIGRSMPSLHQSPSGGYFTTGDLIQTDAAINPGNSGGPLINLNGEVIGINRAIQVSSNTTISGEPGNIGIGFAVPINLVKHIVPTLISDGHYDYPYLGLQTRDDLSLKELDALGLPADTVGAYVVAVDPDGPAAKAGIRGGSQNTSVTGLPSGGDVITAIDGMKVTNFSAFITYLIENKHPGDQVVITVLRDNNSIDITVTVAVRPQ